MQQLKLWAGALGAALLVAGCGGGGGTATGNPVGFTSIATFGDSLSDAGTHAVGSIAALGGGRYTINSGDPTKPAKIWLDHLSAQMGLPAPCAAVTGLNASGAFAAIGGAAPVTVKAGCTNHAQGGSRVTHPVGPYNAALPASSGGLVGQLTYPLTQQASEYLARNGGSFSSKTLVTVMAGGNEVFMQGSVATAAAAIDPTNASTIAGFTAPATNIGGWSAAEQTAVLTGGGQAAVQAGLLANMAKAGTELATLVKTQIVAKGARYVLVINLPNVGASPNGLEGGAQAAALSTGMAQAFNQALSAGLAGTPGVVYADAFTVSTDQFNNPDPYGLSNTTNRSCSQSSPLLGASLGCNPTNLNTGDKSRFQFADDVHPTPYGHQLLAQFVSKVLATAGWL